MLGPAWDLARIADFPSCPATAFSRNFKGRLQCAILRQDSFWADSLMIKLH